MDMLLIAITLTSLTVAIAMAAWTRKLFLEEQRRSEARVIMLERELADTMSESPSIEAPEVPQDTRPESDQMWRTPQESGLFFGGLPTAGDLPRFATTVVLGVLLLGSLTAAGLLFGGDDSARSETIVSGRADHPPLELTSLRHERDGTTWSIVGLVRNPPEGASLDTITAVGFAFDQHGAFLSSGRGLLEFSALAPGTESPFAITITTPERVARYRVGFRTSDGNVIRHIDRRPPPTVDTNEEPTEP